MWYFIGAAKEEKSSTPQTRAYKVGSEMTLLNDTSIHVLVSGEKMQWGISL